MCKIVTSASKDYAEEIFIYFPRKMITAKYAFIYLLLHYIYCTVDALNCLWQQNMETRLLAYLIVVVRITEIMYIPEYSI